MKREQLPDNKDDSLENNGQGALNKKKLRNVPDISLAERFDVPFNQGLTALQVEQRTEEGYVNVDTTKKGKSIARIVLGNIFTFFNIIYILIASVLIAYGQFSNSMFILIIVVNTAIAIIQEIKAKKTLDKLNLVTVPHVTVVRDGERREIGVDELVLDDIIIVENGAQISADSIVAEGMVEVNESILTGESEGVTKRPGDTLFAGSFVVSGKCSAKVDKVGKFNYIASLTGQARKYRKPNSQILRALKKRFGFCCNNHYSHGSVSVDDKLQGIYSQSAVGTGCVYSHLEQNGRIDNFNDTCGTFPAYKRRFGGIFRKTCQTQDNGAGTLLYRNACTRRLPVS